MAGTTGTTGGAAYDPDPVAYIVADCCVAFVEDDETPITVATGSCTTSLVKGDQSDGKTAASTTCSSSSINGADGGGIDMGGGCDDGFVSYMSDGDELEFTLLLFVENNSAGLEMYTSVVVSGFDVQHPLVFTLTLT